MSRPAKNGVTTAAAGAPAARSLLETFLHVETWSSSASQRDSALRRRAAGAYARRRVTVTASPPRDWRNAWVLTPVILPSRVKLQELVS